MARPKYTRNTSTGQQLERSWARIASCTPAARRYHQFTVFVVTHQGTVVMSRCLVCGLVLLLVGPSPTLAADPAADSSRGDRVLDAYFRQQTQRIADACLSDIKTREQWEKK